MKIKRLVVSSFQTNCYVLYDHFQAVIIDPGDQAKKIKNFINENELDVLAILLTHGHCDHIGAIDALYQAFACPIYLHHEDHVYLKEPKYNLSMMMGNPLIIQAPVLDCDETMQIGPFKVRWHHLPGHTPGSSMIELIDQKIIFSGDVLFNGSIGRFDFPLSSHHDTVLSMKKLKEFQEDARVFPGHGEETSIKNEQQYNPYLK